MSTTSIERKIDRYELLVNKFINNQTDLPEEIELLFLDIGMDKEIATFSRVDYLRIKELQGFILAE